MPSSPDLTDSSRTLAARILPYVQIARPDHWFKNLFMALGILLAVFQFPELFAWASVVPVVQGIVATCILASSNYVINELLDAPTDLHHPVKRHRPVPSGKVDKRLALVEWLALGAVGLWVAFSLNVAFGVYAAVFWSMGVIYNMPPIRTKEVPYLDVLSESINNPLRLGLGWHALVPNVLPPSSLVLAYWMIGAYFMAAKRLAEYRFIADPEVAAGYRASFRHYDEDRLLVSIMFYVTACAFFAGVFMVRYKLELILFVPFAAGFCAYYLRIGLLPDSPVQNPERLYRQRGFLLYGILCVLVFTLLMFVQIEPLYALFDVSPANTPPLWSWRR